MAIIKKIKNKIASNADVAFGKIFDTRIFSTPDGKSFKKMENQVKRMGSEISSLKESRKKMYDGFHESSLKRLRDNRKIKTAEDMKKFRNDDSYNFFDIDKLHESHKKGIDNEIQKEFKNWKKKSNGSFDEFKNQNDKLRLDNNGEIKGIKSELGDAGYNNVYKPLKKNERELSEESWNQYEREMDIGMKRIGHVKKGVSGVATGALAYQGYKHFSEKE